MMMRAKVILLLLILLMPAAAAAQADWPGWRGPDQNGMWTSSTHPPNSWSETENIDWKVEVPGLGWSSPVVRRGRVFVTTAVAGGITEPSPGLPTDSQGNETLSSGSTRSGSHDYRVYCFQLDSGDDCDGWSNGYTSVHTASPEAPRHVKSSYANETPVVDRRSVFVRFGDLGLWSLSVDDGSINWEVMTEAGSDQSWGSGSSPVLADGNVVIAYDDSEGTWLAAWDKADGSSVWQVPRVRNSDLARGYDLREEHSTWATPYVWRRGGRGGNIDIIVSDVNSIVAYNARTGRRRWYLRGACADTSGVPECEKSWAAISSPFVADDRLYVGGGYRAGQPRPLYRITPNASGDISLEWGETSGDNVDWFLDDAGSYMPSGIVRRGIYYNVKTRGRIEAFSATSGGELFEERIEVGAYFTASPIVYNGRIFALSEEGDTYVIRANDNFRLLRVNSLGEMALASPAVAGERLLIRTRFHLWSIKN